MKKQKSIIKKLSNVFFKKNLIFFKKRILVNPNYVHALYNYAMFLQDDKKQLYKAKEVIFLQKKLNNNNISGV